MRGRGLPIYVVPAAHMLVTGICGFFCWNPPWSSTAGISNSRAPRSVHKSRSFSRINFASGASSALKLIGLGDLMGFNDRLVKLEVCQCVRVHFEGTKKISS